MNVLDDLLVRRERGRDVAAGDLGSGVRWRLGRSRVVEVDQELLDLVDFLLERLESIDTAQSRETVRIRFRVR